MIGEPCTHVRSGFGLDEHDVRPDVGAEWRLLSQRRTSRMRTPFIQLLPLTALVDALRAVVLEGASLASIWNELAIMAGWTIVPFAIALKYSGGDDSHVARLDSGLDALKGRRTKHPGVRLLDKSRFADGESV